MLTLITGWLQEAGNRISFPSKSSDLTREEFVEVNRISPSEYGYRVEHDEIKRL